MDKLCRLATSAGCAFALIAGAVSCGFNDNNIEKRDQPGPQFESRQEFKSADRISDSFSFNRENSKRTRPEPTESSSKRLRSDKNAQCSEKECDFSIPKNGSQSNFRLLTINKSALDREFLLRTNFIQGDAAPTFHNLKSRVVAFSKRSGRIILVEATDGHSYYDSIPQNLILSEFEIEKETKDSISFDFDRGMSKLYTIEDWYAQDLGGSKPAPFSEQFHSLEFNHSYIEDMQVDTDADYLLIRQVAQMEDGSSYIPIEARYYFEPYRPSQTFKPSLSSKNKRKVGFFEVNPSINKSGTARTYASKFNLDKPIQFALSSNTPNEYKEVIKEGVEYWNNSLGAGTITVVDAPDGLTAPQYNINMIQWIDWDQANGAYADAQMDPRTGEVLNVQIYLTSVFAINGKQKARAAVASFQEAAEKEISEAEVGVPTNFLKKALTSNHKSGLNRDDNIFSDSRHEDKARSNKKGKKRISLRGFEHDNRCSYSPVQSFANAMSNLLATDVEDEAFDKISKDYLRGVVAHEVGHTLGFRHNFAGSSAASFNIQERDDIFKDYVRNGRVDDKVTISSSIMDYSPFEESSMLGSQIKLNDRALSYDKLAVGILYKDENIDEHANTPLFCTDSHLSSYIDCNIWASGSSPLAHSQYHTARNFETFPNKLIEHFISRSKSVPNEKERMPFTHILMSNQESAVGILQPRMRALETLVSGTRALWLDRSYGYVTNGNYRDIDQKFAEWIDSELTTYGQGDWENILNHMPKNYGDWVYQEFSKLVRSPSYRSGLGPAGRYEFSDTEIDQMCDAVKQFMKEMETALVEVNLMQLSLLSDVSNQKIGDEGKELDDSFVKYLAKTVREVVFTEKEDSLEPEKNKKSIESLSVLTKATLIANDELELDQKLTILKMLMDSMDGKIEFKIPDDDPTKMYQPKDLQLLASQFLSGVIDQILQSDLFKNLSEQAKKEADQVSLPNAEPDIVGELATGEVEEPKNLIDVSLSLDEEVDVLVNEVKKQLATTDMKYLTSNKPDFKRATNSQIHKFHSLTIKHSDNSKKSPSSHLQKSRLEHPIQSSDIEMSDGESHNDELNFEHATDSDSFLEIEGQSSNENEPDEEVTKIGAVVPCYLKFEIELSEFKYEPETREFASRLLSTANGESPMYAVRDRDELSKEFIKSYLPQLRGIDSGQRPLAAQSKKTGGWIQEYESIAGALRGSIDLAKVLGGMM